MNTQPSEWKSDPAIRNVIDALAAAGISTEATVLPESTRTAAQAAAAIGCDVGAIANSLIFMADDQPLLVLTSGSHRVDPDALAVTLGHDRIRKATAAEVKEATGQSIGGVSPVGHPHRGDTVIDKTLADHGHIWAAAGTSNAVFSATFEQLMTATGARAVDVT